MTFRKIKLNYNSKTGKLVKFICYKNKVCSYHILRNMGFFPISTKHFFLIKWYCCSMLFLLNNMRNNIVEYVLKYYTRQSRYIGDTAFLSIYDFSMEIGLSTRSYKKKVLIIYEVGTVNRPIIQFVWLF